jgi:hypothetical protein
MHTAFVHTNHDLLSLLSEAFDTQDALAREIIRDSKPDMVVDEALHEGSLSSNTRDTNLVSHCTHAHSNNERIHVGEAKHVSRKKKGCSLRRRRKRQEKAAIAYAPILNLASKRVLKHPMPTRISLQGMPIANGAYVGKQVQGVNRMEDLQTLLNKGFRLLEWNGRCDTYVM